MSREAYVGHVYNVTSAIVADIDGTPGWEVTMLAMMPDENKPVRGDTIYFEVKHQEGAEDE